MVPNSVLKAIQAGMWDFEPENTETNEYEATKALPGSHEKLTIMADRLEQGLPLWHPKDRRTYEDANVE